MADNLLYFPYINLPKTDWTIRMLLYYDKIGSIVPLDFFNHPEKKYEKFMHTLVEQKLVIPIDPIQHLEHPWKLNQPFTDFVQSKGFKLEAKRESFLRGENELINRNKFHSHRTKISSQKFDDNLLYALSELGLAKKTEGNWYEVEQVTANYLMTYLASVIANKLQMLPVTDKTISVGNVKIRTTRVNGRISDIRDKVLKEIIPLPLEIDLNKLRAFKDSNHGNLNRFKNLVEQIALNPLYNDERLLTEKIKELNYERQSLTARMNEKKIGTIFFGSVCGVFGAVQGLAQAETTGAIIGGLPGFASAIYGAIKAESPENIIDQTGIKYLSLIERRLRYNKQYPILI
jgi:hypothetical protein